MSRASSHTNSAAGFADLQEGISSPVKMMTVELEYPIPAVSLSDNATGRDFKRLLSLVRLHGQPLGMVSVEGNEIDSTSHARAIWDAFGPDINAHLAKDGLSPLTALPIAGIPMQDTPSCLQNRRKVLADAPFVSIVATTRDRPQDLEDCLHSLLELEYPSYEIVVVDNAPSTNETSDLVQKIRMQHANVRYVLEEIPGLSQARNCGMIAARGEIVVFTDDDIVADPAWLTALVSGFSVDDNVACVTGLILPKELDTPAQVWCEEHGGFGKGYTRKIYDTGKNRPQDPLFPYRISKFGSGANMAFKTSTLRKLGGFDPALGAGTPTRSGSEFPPLFNVITNGYQIVYEPSAIIYHEHHREFQKFAKQFYGYGVGFTAFLTKSILENPIHLFRLMMKVPAGLSFIFSPKSEKHQHKTANYPKELNGLELKGLLYGPVAYFRSRKICKGRRLPYKQEELPNSL